MSSYRDKFTHSSCPIHHNDNAPFAHSFTQDEVKSITDSLQPYAAVAQQRYSEIGDNIDIFLTAREERHQYPAFTISRLPGTYALRGAYLQSNTIENNNFLLFLKDVEKVLSKACPSSKPYVFDL
ncbi:MAG: hypothetical protein DI551_06180 [Micavibrio aeruginosavorus]|uniref:Uncharacterized protein n=1 Tax=Micavibrio aeruginosavorus TaxID=349221 RepID=A0A2W5MZV4_9BACT|nr:MAG: hypothetical protein DI551_06180 [Micavibrio aeruginosavorus]